MTSYAAFLRNILKISLAPWALAINTLKISLKRREKTQKVSFAPSERQKMVDFFRCSWFCSPLENFLRAPMVAPPLSWEERRFCHNQRYSDVSSVNVVQRHTVSGGVSKPSFNYCRVVCSSALPASCLQVNVVRSRSRLLSRGVLIISLVLFSVQCTLLHSRGKTWMRASEFGRIFVGRETSLASIAHVPCLSRISCIGGRSGVQEYASLCFCFLPGGT